MTDKRNNCYCGNCDACARSLHWFAKMIKATGKRCGHKRSCDCAEWERKWNDKIADPGYYSRSTVRQPGSALGASALHRMGDFTDLSVTGVKTKPFSWRQNMGDEAAAGVSKREMRNAA